MNYLVGKEYNTRDGRTVRCLATDAKGGPADTPYPLITIDTITGVLHAHQANGRVFPTLDSRYDLVPKVTRVEGWTAVIRIRIPGGDRTSLGFLYHSKEQAEMNYPALPVVFISVSVEETC